MHNKTAKFYLCQKKREKKKSEAVESKPPSVKPCICSKVHWRTSQDLNLPSLLAFVLAF